MIRNKLAQILQNLAAWHIKQANRLMINYPYGSFGWARAELHLACANWYLELAQSLRA